MEKIFLYAHGGSGNHGCEAIVRSTVNIFGDNSNVYLVSSNPDEDYKYNVSSICNVVSDISNYSKYSLFFLSAYFHLKIQNDYEQMDMLQYKKSVGLASKGDIALSIGGDNYCYADVNKYIMLHKMYLKQGAKTVLWGCSVEPEILKNPIIAEDISKYSLITARETISYNALKEINTNTVLVPDTAFYLKPILNPLPEGFEEKGYVGINVSPMVIGHEMSQGIVTDNYEALIKYILDNTGLKIMLIPHVVWKDGDDRIPLRNLYEKFSYSNRITIIDDCNCQELKGYISRCRFFVGARTHATIAAYSSLVPTLVVGYSVKARGIARDLFGDEENFVLPVQNMISRNDLVSAYKYIEENELDIIKQLEKKLQEYKTNDILMNITNELLD